ncbi:MAG: hypothetical protein M1831_000301 [Alyxoria varia]|nr:MAG: hypothetical protein M1831_000301 [Alyxoria varia]
MKWKLDESSGAPQDLKAMELEEELLAKIPKLLGKLKINHRELQRLAIGKPLAAFSFIDRADGSRHIIQIATSEIGDAQGSEMEDYVAVLRYLNTQMEPIPIPGRFDISSDNAIDRPFVIQSRMRGQRLADIYPKLSFEEKLQVTQLIADQFMVHESIPFMSTGTLRSGKKGGVRVGELCDKNGYPVQKPVDDDCSVRDWLIWLLNQKLDRLRKDPFNEMNKKMADVLRQFVPMVRDMDMLSYFSDEESLDRAVLWHPQFDWQNVFVAIDTRTRHLHLSGISGWRHAAAKPRILARDPPSFLWREDAFEDTWYSGSWHDDAHETPPKNISRTRAKAKAMKYHFDDYMMSLSPSWMEEAYGRGQWIRRVADVAICEMEPSPEVIENINALLKDWSTKKQNLLRSSTIRKRRKLAKTMVSPDCPEEKNACWWLRKFRSHSLSRTTPQTQQLETET